MSKQEKDMRVLTLIIKQQYFDAILEGRKVQEFREVRPTTIKKLLQLDEEGYELEDEEGLSIPVEYDAIRFYVGYNADRDTALVEVQSAYSEMLVDDNGELITYEHGGEMWIAQRVVYNLGKILEHNIRDQSRKR